MRSSSAFRPKPCRTGLSLPRCASLTGTVLAVGENVLQPLLQLIRPFPLQVQLPLEILELWGNRGKMGVEAQQGHRWGDA